MLFLGSFHIGVQIKMKLANAGCLSKTFPDAKLQLKKVICQKMEHYFWKTWISEWCWKISMTWKFIHIFYIFFAPVKHLRLLKTIERFNSFQYQSIYCYWLMLNMIFFSVIVLYCLSIYFFNSKYFSSIPINIFQ